jgi:hypothetical protein
VVFRLDVSRSAMENETRMMNTSSRKGKIVMPNTWRVGHKNRVSVFDFCAGAGEIEGGPPCHDMTCFAAYFRGVENLSNWRS